MSMEEQPQGTFDRSVEDGERRLKRTWPGLLATGAVGGFDLSLGVLGSLIVYGSTGNELLGALAFSIGFIALTLANSELFTENFLVPLAAVVARRAPATGLVRLWVGTFAMNLVGGWVAMGLVIVAFPGLEDPAVELGRHLPRMGITGAAFASAMLGGIAITLMTWMERGSQSIAGKLAAAISVAFLLGAAPLSHSVVSSLKMFGALHSGAPFGYLDWLGATSWSILGNMVGGIGLVTVLRFIQVGRSTLNGPGTRGPERTRMSRL